MWKCLSLIALLIALGIGFFNTDYRYKLYQAAIERQFSRLKEHSNDIGAFCLQYENGKITKFGQSSSHLKCSATMILLNEREFFRKLFLFKAVGFGDSFVDKDWTVPNDEDIADVIVHLAFKLHLRHKTIPEMILSYLNYEEWKLYLERIGVTKSIVEDKQTISHHYDLGNDFYYNFLDKTMMYTCAFWNDPTNDYTVAQHNKIEIMMKKLNIKSTDHILDVGSGWGYMASYIANKTNATIDGIALAKDQISWAKQNYISENTQYKYADYREYCQDKVNQGKYNKIYSIGMLEHVHEKRIDEFMECMYRLLPDNHDETMIMGLHYINRNNIYPEIVPVDNNHRCDTVTWVGKYLLPGGCLLNTDWVHQSAVRAGFVMLHQERYGLHYAQTTRLWRKNIENNWDEIIEGHPNYDMRLKRSYMFLFATAEVGFRMGFMDLTQHIFIKPNKNVSGFVDGKFNHILKDVINVNERHYQ